MLLLLIQSLSRVQLFSIPWTVAQQASMSFTISQSLFRLMFIESVMPSNHLILCRPLLLPLIFPSIRVLVLGILLLLLLSHFSHVQFFVTPCPVACQAPPSMGFSRQEYWIGLPFPTPGDLPDPRIEPGSPALQADSSPSEPPGKPTYFL